MTAFVEMRSMGKKITELEAAGMQLKERPTSLPKSPSNGNLQRLASGDNSNSKVDTGSSSTTTTTITDESTSPKTWRLHSDVCLKTYYVCSLSLSTAVIFAMIVSFVTPGWESVRYDTDKLLRSAVLYQEFKVSWSAVLCSKTRNLSGSAAADVETSCSD